jgi:hypothetical protein
MVSLPSTGLSLRTGTHRSGSDSTSSFTATILSSQVAAEGSTSIPIDFTFGMSFALCCLASVNDDPPMFEIRTMRAAPTSWTCSPAVARAGGSAARDDAVAERVV